MEIEMCQDDTCPAKATCHRHEARGTVAVPQQTYGGYRHDDGGRCESYWPTVEGCPHA